MTPIDIQIGTRIELELLNNKGEKVGNTFVSQMLEFQDENLIVISAPIFEGRVIFVPVNVLIRLNFLHHKLGLQGFTAHVIQKEYRGNIAVIIIKPESGLESIQRRMHFRLDTVSNVLLWPVEADDSDNGEITELVHADAKKAITKNVSGSGACIVTETNIPRNSYIRVEMDLSGATIIKAKCKVIRNNLVEDRRGRRYELGLCFVEISQKDQNNLIKYIFDQQRLLLKKNM